MAITLGETPYDVIVAGGGPAGSTTASYLRKHGRRVLVLEREEFPRFHIGESLLPCCGEIWDELELKDEMARRFIRKPGARFIHNESGAEYTYYFAYAIRPDHPFAYEVQRGEFDQMLLENAARLGAEVRYRTEVRDVEFLPDRVRVTARPAAGPEYQVEGQLLVDATGRDTFLGGRCGLKVTDDLVTTNVACYTHYENCQRQPGSDEGNITIVLFDGGWWWFIPFRGILTSIGCVLQKDFTRSRRGLSPEEMFAAALAETPAMQKLLVGATRLRPVGTTGNWSYRCRQYYGDRFLLVGDAAAFIDPLFSTGVLMAMQGGRFAAAAIHAALKAGDLAADRFAGYQQQAVQGADLFKRLVHEFYGESLRKLLVHSAAHETTRSAITSLLAGDVYRPAMWHSFLREGFTRNVTAGGLAGRELRRSG
ncbi:MAG TPA: NAD(P)/FAD-dependent oxidoreductase [Pseudomonadota bacterium]|nr:NAD(P)/FAD-dependent oxidoreductase [Pseudomonadota bacterium]